MSTMLKSKYEDKLVDLESKVNEVIKLGQSWGMTEMDIRECLNEATIDGKEKLNPSLLMKMLSFILCILKSVVGLTVIIGLTVVFLYTTLMISSALSSDIEHLAGRVAAPFIYPTMRFGRMLLKPIADNFDINGLYGSECLIDNPFYLDIIEDCQPCNIRSRFADLTGQNVQRLRSHVDEMHPFVIRGYMKSKVDLSVLHKMYLDNEAQFRSAGTTMFKSNLDGVYNISDVFSQFNQDKFLDFRRGTGYVSWETNSVANSQAIRKIFPRPNFLTPTSEVSLMKRIYIESPLVGSHELPIGGFATVWYQQAHGTRHFVLVPHPDCTAECQEMELTVKAGDFVFYQDQFWRLLSGPVMIEGRGVAASSDLSVGFSGSFAI